MRTCNPYPDRWRAGRRNRRGFSLLELALVIAIIAVIGALAAPRFANASARQRLEAAARRVDADLNYARQLAKASSDTRIVQFPGDNTCVLVDDEGVRLASTDYNVQPYEVKISVALDNAGTDITLNGFGYPDTGGTVTLTGGGSSIVLEIDPVTGGVTRR